MSRRLKTTSQRRSLSPKVAEVGEDSSKKAKESLSNEKMFSAPDTRALLPYHRLADLVPMMSDEELAILAKDIKANGLREPIMLYEGAILDGRNRYKACLLANVEPRTETYKEGKNPLSYVISMNINRRHLKASQYAVIAVRIANMKSGTRTDLQPRAKMPEVSLEQAAEMLNVSRRIVVTAKEVMKNAKPEQIRDIVSGKKTISQVRRELSPPKPLPEMVPVKISKNAYKLYGIATKKKKYPISVFLDMCINEWCENHNFIKIMDPILEDRGE